MNKIEETLWNDYVKVNELIEVTEVNDEGYKLLLEEKDRIRNELIKLKQNDMDVNLKLTQVKAEDKREKIRNGITIGTFVVSTGVSVFAIVKTFKFDQVATVTSTLGRNILNGVVPKMFKR